MNVKEILNGWYEADMERHRLNQIPEILHRMKQGELTREQLISIIGVRYQAAHFFEEMLEDMHFAIHQGRFRTMEGEFPWPECKEALRAAVLTNLSEERGEIAEYGGPHSNARKVFLEALGVDYEKWQPDPCGYNSPERLDELVAYVLGQMQFAIHCGAIEAVAALWYYENRISLDGVHGDYCILLKAFEGAFPEFKKPQGSYKEGDPLWHLASHAQHDEHHAKLAEDALSTLDGKPGMWEDSIDIGIRTAHLALLNFWNGLSERHCGAFDSRAHWKHERLVV